MVVMENVMMNQQKFLVVEDDEYIQVFKEDFNLGNDQDYRLKMMSRW